jgi:Zn-finger protein
MTPEERQALRETHVKWVEFDDDGELTWFCRKCNFVDFPCDVIKVLDAYDELYENNENALESLTITLNLVQQLAKTIP